MNSREKALDFLKDYWTLCKKHNMKIQEFSHEELYNAVVPLHKDDQLNYSDMNWKKGSPIRNVEILSKYVPRYRDYQKSID